MLIIAETVLWNKTESRNCSLKQKIHIWSHYLSHSIIIGTIHIRYLIILNITYYYLLITMRNTKISTLTRPFADNLLKIWMILHYIENWKDIDNTIINALSRLTERGNIVFRGWRKDPLKMLNRQKLGITPSGIKEDVRENYSWNRKILSHTNIDNTSCWRAESEINYFFNSETLMTDEF